MKTVQWLLVVLLLNVTVTAQAQTPRIGPSIGDELNAAGVAGLPFAWNPETGQVRTDDPLLTAAQRTAVLAVFAAHDPTTKSAEQRETQAKRATRQAFLDHCGAIEADATLSAKVKRLCELLKKVIP